MQLAAALVLPCLLLSGCSLLFSVDEGGDGAGVSEGDGGGINPGQKANIDDTGCPEGFDIFEHSSGTRCFRERSGPSIFDVNNACAGSEHMGVPAHLVTFPGSGEIQAAHAYCSTLQEGDVWVGLFAEEATATTAWSFATGEAWQGVLGDEKHPTARCAAFSDPGRLLRWPCAAASLSKTVEQAICEWDGLEFEPALLPPSDS